MKFNINFSTAGFGKLFQIADNISDSNPGKQAILSVSNALPQSVEATPPVEFKSIAELVGIEYTGYVIEKERFDVNSQSWIKIDEYKLIGSKSNVFRDTRVAYGFTYRYRMKSVLKITDKRKVEGASSSEDEFEYISTYYESLASKNWTVVDIVNLTPPPYPQTIKIFPNSTKKEVVLCWLKPVDETEIRFYNIYRRAKVGDPWSSVVEGLQEFETLFVDQKVELGQKYIYAISSIDIHGIESFLSTQIGVELNANIAIEKKEKDLVWISGGGTSLNEIGLVLKKFFERKEQLVARKNIVLRPNTKFREESKDFIVKVTSLDTHEKFELKVTLRNQKLQGNE